MEKRGLTEQERFVCVARWINFLYTGYVYGTFGPEDGGGCTDCPQYDFCPSNTTKRIEEIKPGELIPIAFNFKVLEKFAGPDTVISGLPCHDPTIADIYDRYFSSCDASDVTPLKTGHFRKG